MRRRYPKRAPVAGMILGFGILTCLHAATDSTVIEGGNLRLEFDGNMHSRVIARFDGKDIVMGPFAPSETITVDGSELKDFTLTSEGQRRVNDSFGPGKQITLIGASGRPKNGGGNDPRPVSPNGVLRGAVQKYADFEFTSYGLGQQSVFGGNKGR